MLIMPSIGRMQIICQIRGSNMYLVPVEQQGEIREAMR